MKTGDSWTSRQILRISREVRLVSVRWRTLDVALREPFAIAGGTQDMVRNVLVEVRLSDGTAGFGECAPLPAFNGETQAAAAAAVRQLAPALAGAPFKSLQTTARSLMDIIPHCASARAGVEMALLDAWARSRRVPLSVLFGGAGETVITDVTIPIVPPEHAARAAKAARRFGIRALKIKVGTDPEEDARRVQAAAIAGRPKSLIVDGNAGYSTSQALLLLSRLSRAGIRPDLFEQPVGKDDLEGLCAVSRKGGVPVAADESASSLEDILRLARMKAVQVINIKLMKSGVLGALEWARATRAAGLDLMIGGMIESRLAMACAAHLAAGFGGFRFVDLDTPLLLAEDPMAGGPRIGRGGIWDLSAVAAGIGIRPKSR